MAAYIRISDKCDEEVYKISSKDEAVTFSGNSIEFTIPPNTLRFSALPESYTLNLDKGVAIQAAGGCGSAAASGTIILKGRAVFFLLSGLLATARSPDMG